MAANVQWDVYSKSGTDPDTSKAYTPIVRMLYNEQEIQFNASCTPIAASSTWYKESELKRCLSGIATTESPIISVTDNSTDNNAGNSNNNSNTSTGTNDSSNNNHTSSSESTKQNKVLSPITHRLQIKQETPNLWLQQVLTS
jgi:hypothetical protein